MGHVPAALVLAALAGCGGDQVREVDKSAPAMEGYRHIEDLYIVDCLLPGEVRQMGKMTKLSPRKPTKLPGTAASGVASTWPTAGPTIVRP